MRAKFRLSDIRDLEGLIYKLSEVGVSVADIYRQLAEGKEKNIEFYVEKDKVQAVSSAIKGFCQFEVVYEVQENKWIPFLLLGTLWLDSALLYFLLKLSFLSEDFNYFLSQIFGSNKLVAFVKGLVSLLAILVYYLGFIFARGTTPVGKFFGLKIEKDHIYAVVLFSLPFIAFYLLQFNQTFIKILGLFALSLCVVMPFYLKDSVRG
ncbi:hypothetical protein [Thermocrinis sp.]|jgi:hypothetical protein|uniref:hypothetical protein n=1 Tax=Thermocrinis sp. TaxID=2024383 RepID=UPI00261B9A60|nr:hypothetical protein [Thermocrinis sp.]